MAEIETAWPPAEILTSRLLIRASKSEDRAAYIELLSSPEVWKYLGGERSAEELELLVPDIPGNHPGVFVVEAEGAFAGTVVLDRRDPGRPGHLRHEGSELEVSYTFLPEWWGKGLAAEAVESVLGWATRELHEIEVVLCTQTANLPSMRLAQRLGFTEVCRFTEFEAEQWLGVRSLESAQRSSLGA